MARTIEHLNSQALDIARKSSRAKPEGPSPIHGGMASHFGTMAGVAPTGKPSDASSPLPTDPSLEGKHHAPCMVHPSMSKQAATANFNGEDVLREGVIAHRGKSFTR